MPGARLSLGEELERALTHVNVPAYVIDIDGILVWLNPAAERIVGDAEGRRFTDVVAPHDRRRARDIFTRKILGTTKATDAMVDVLRPDGSRTMIEISSAPLVRGRRIIGVFGLVSRPPEPGGSPMPWHPHLTPRQLEVLRMLSQGASTMQISEVLHIERETVRNHVRAILRALGVHSRIEAVARARTEGLLDE